MNILKVIKDVCQDGKGLYRDVREQDLGFWLAALYLVFTYMKPQVTFPVIDFLPWAQIIILSGLIYIISKGQFKFQIVHFGYFLFFLIIWFSCFNAVYPEISWQRLDIAYVALIEIIFFTNCIKNEKQFKLIMIVLFLLLFKMSFFGAKTWVSRGFGFTSWGIAGPTGLFSNSGEFSLLMAIYAMLALGFVSGHIGARKIYYLTVITAVMTVLGASSRGSQIAILLGLLFVAIALGKLNIKNIMITTFIVVGGYQLLPVEQKARFESMGDDNTSQSRIIYWTAGVDMMNDHKMTGVGYFNFAEYFHYNYKSGLQSEYLSSRREVAHNSLVEAGSEMGYPGLLIYLWLHYICYSLNRKSAKLAKNKPGCEWVARFSLCSNAAIFVYFIGAFFMSVAYYPYIYLLLMISQCLYNACRDDKKLNLH